MSIHGNEEHARALLARLRWTEMTRRDRDDAP